MTKTRGTAAGWGALFVICGYAALFGAAYAQHSLIF